MRNEDETQTPWQLLRWTYGLVPIIAGADKFTNFLTDWTKYLSPVARDALPIAPSSFMMIVGVIEIIAGLLVLSRYTRLGAYVVSAWLVGIAINLVTTGTYFDLAVRDLVMAIGAFALAKLSEARAHVATGMGARPRSRGHDIGHPAPSMG
jgi:uncharacterized membrane protein YphA (DoxX/SURF4 family)